MANREIWHDEYWLPLLQLFLKKPQGVKPIYSKPLVDLALELHFEPRRLHHYMMKLRQIDTPSLKHLWDTYANNPRKLSKEIKKIKQMNGFGNAEEFYAGVELSLSWELDFKPIAQWKLLSGEEQRGSSPIKPVMLIPILDMYFHLTPITMVVETPEVIQMSKLIGLKPRLIVHIMDMFRLCDPNYSHDNLQKGPLYEPCAAIWARYGNNNQEDLSALAAQLKDYF